MKDNSELLAIHYAELTGAQIAYSIAGEGPPLLLLHGFPETHAAWLQVVPLLAPAFTLVMPDLPGYGDSFITAEGGDERYAKQNMARLLVAFMEQLGYPAFFIAGHDRGGRVACAWIFRTGYGKLPCLISYLSPISRKRSTFPWRAHWPTGGLWGNLTPCQKPCWRQTTIFTWSISLTIGLVAKRLYYRRCGLSIFVVFACPPS